MEPREGIENYREIPSFILPEIPGVFARAVKAGAHPPLEFAGAGQYGIVLCDHWGRAWKVGRLQERPDAPKEWAPRIARERLFMLSSLTDEYEWLHAAAGSEIAANVAEVYDIHPEELVLERECVEGRSGAWADGSYLRELHRKIDRAMIPRGWTAPEFKENSYIIRPDDTSVLVDISMVMRVGRNLVGFVEDVLAGRRKTHERLHDLAYYVLGEVRQKTIPPEIGKELLDRLAERDPEIRRSFTLP